MNTDSIIAAIRHRIGRLFVFPRITAAMSRYANILISRFENRLMRPTRLRFSNFGQSHPFLSHAMKASLTKMLGIRSVAGSILLGGRDAKATDAYNVFTRIYDSDMKKRTVGSKAKSIALGGLVGLLGFLPLKSNADLVNVAIISESGVTGSSMSLRHHPNGLLYHDSGDQRWSTYLENESPPGMGENDNWLWIYSEQYSQYVGEGWEYRRDNRPFSGEDTNKNFPLILDTQGPNSISSSNNFVRFELQDGPDTNRPYYHWTKTLDFDAGASWSDGHTESTRSGTWDLTANTTTNLPLYNLTNAQGQYATLDVLPLSAVTTLGTPISWYIDRGIITNDYELIDTTDFNDDGYTGRQKFLMNVDDLFDDSDYFKTISLSLTNGTPAIVIPHSKADRRYRLHATPTLSPPDWTSPTNSLGTGGTLTLEAPDDESPTRFFKATVELP